MDKILEESCPFCGGKVKEDKFQHNMSQAVCTKCGERWGACSSVYTGRYKKWNKRYKG